MHGVVCLALQDGDAVTCLPGSAVASSVFTSFLGLRAFFKLGSGAWIRQALTAGCALQDVKPHAKLDQAALPFLARV